MMGRQTDDQGHLFYDFRLDAAVPDDHPVRRIDAVLDLSWVYVELAPYVVNADWLAEELTTLAKRWSRKPAAKRSRPA